MNGFATNMDDVPISIHNNFPSDIPVLPLPPNTNNHPPPSSSKPRSSKPHKPRSPSPTPPTPPPPPPPLQTIRLQIKLGGPDNYAVDIANVARATGQRPPTPPIALAAGGVASDSDDDEDDKEKDKDKDNTDKDKDKVKDEPTKKKKKVHPPPFFPSPITHFILYRRKTPHQSTTMYPTPLLTTQS